MQSTDAVEQLLTMLLQVATSSSFMLLKLLVGEKEIWRKV